MYIQCRTTISALMNAEPKLPPGAGQVLAQTDAHVASMRAVLAPALGQSDLIQDAVIALLSKLWVSETAAIMKLKQPPRAVEAFFQNEAAGANRFQRRLCGVISGILSATPNLNATSGILTLRVPLVSVLKDPAAVVHGIVESLCEVHIGSGAVELGAGLAGVLHEKLLHASHLDREAADKRPYRMKWPKASDLVGEELVKTYLGGTPFADLLLTPVPLRISDEIRFSHSVCFSGSGGGKSQLIGHILAQEAKRPQHSRTGLVVLDSTGDLYRKVVRSKAFATDNRVLMVDVEDTEYLPALNLFGLDQGRNFQSEGEREAAIETTIDLTEYVVAGMMGTEFTGQQMGAFRYLIRLMLEMPGANLLTLQDVLDNPTRYLPVMERMQGVTRVFFEKQFITKGYNPTRQQISRRIARLLSNRIFEKMFSATENRLDLGRALDAGRLVAVNTSRATLKDGCSVFGRFILANVMHAGFARARVPETDRHPAYVLIDEASEYLDDALPGLFEQLRKYRCGIHCFLQSTDQMDHAVRARVMASTAIKLAGGGSAKDARTMADDLHCSPEFIMAQQLDKHGPRFATFVRGLTPHAVSWHFPFGSLESMGEMDAASFERQQERSRRELAVVKPMRTPAVPPVKSGGVIVPMPAPKPPVRKFTVTKPVR